MILLRLSEVIEMTGLSRSTIYRYESAAACPSGEKCDSTVFVGTDHCTTQLAAHANPRFTKPGMDVWSIMSVRLPTGTLSRPYG